MLRYWTITHTNARAHALTARTCRVGASCPSSGPAPSFSPHIATQRTPAISPGTPSLAQQPRPSLSALHPRSFGAPPQHRHAHARTRACTQAASCPTHGQAPSRLSQEWPALPRRRPTGCTRLPRAPSRTWWSSRSTAWSSLPGEWVASTLLYWRTCSTAW